MKWNDWKIAMSCNIGKLGISWSLKNDIAWPHNWVAIGHDKVQCSAWRWTWFFATWPFIFHALYFVSCCILYLCRLKFFSKICKSSLRRQNGAKYFLEYRLFFLRLIAQFFTQIYMNCLSVHKLKKLGKFW